MARDPETDPNPFAGLFTLPPVGGPTNQTAMEARRRMALQVMANSKRGFPKTLGEGLTAIGDALGERGTLNRLDAQEAAYQKQASAEAEAGIPEEARTPAAAPQRASEAVPSGTTTTAMATPGDISEPPAVPVAPAPSVFEGGPAASPVPYFNPQLTQPPPSPPPAVVPPTRSVLPAPSSAPASFADRFGSFAPPGAASPPPVVNSRDAAAAALLSRSAAPGVPPANPMLGGQAPLGMPSPSGSAPLPGGQPDQRLAQATMAARPPGTATDIRPAPPLPTPQRLAPQDRMPTPQDVPMTEDQKRGYRTLARGAALGDANIQRQGQALIEYGASQQKQAYDAKLKDWQDQMLERRQRQTAEEAFARTQSTPQAQAEAQVKAREADVANRFGGAAPYQQFVADMSKSYDATQQLANTLPTFRQAKQALVPGPNAAYTGSGAEAKLDANKMLRAVGVPGNYTPAIATELLQSRMKAIAGGLIKSTVGSQNISDADREFVEKAYSGNISMEPESLRRLLGIAEDTTIRSINRHNDRLNSVASDPVKDIGLRNQYAVPMQYGDQAVAYLKAHPETANMFDEKFGKGHARAILAGTRYGQ